MEYDLKTITGQTTNIKIPVNNIAAGMYMVRPILVLIKFFISRAYKMLGLKIYIPFIKKILPKTK